MRIGVKQAFFEDRLQHQLDQGVHQARHRFGVQLGILIDPFAGRKLQRQHGRARALRDDIRNPEVGNIRQCSAKERHGTRFATLPMYRMSISPFARFLRRSTSGLPSKARFWILTASA